MFPLLDMSSNLSVQRSTPAKPDSENSRGFPTMTVVLSTAPRAPLPWMDSKFSTAPSSMSSSSAPRTTALPIGCSEPDSSVPAILRNCARFPSVTTSTSVIAPRVRVPVLSKTTVSTPFARSNTSAFLNRTPISAPRPEPTMIAVGVARPRAQGQAMISTATPLRTAVATSPEKSSQVTATASAITITTGTKTPEIRSASRCTGALVACASATSFMIWLRAVFGPTSFTSISSRPC